MDEANKEMERSAKRLVGLLGRKTVNAATLEELENGVDELMIDAGALITKTMNYSKDRKEEWQKIQKLSQKKKMADRVALGRVSGCEFEAVVKDNSLEIKFKTFGQRLNINLISGEFTGGNSLDIIYALSISPRIFEPVYWQGFFKKASQTSYR